MSDEGAGISAGPRGMMKVSVVAQEDVHFVRVVCSGSAGPCSELQTTSLRSGPFLYANTTFRQLPSPTVMKKG